MPQDPDAEVCVQHVAQHQEEVALLNLLLIAVGEVDAGRVEEVVPYGSGRHDDAAGAFLEDGDFADGFGEGDVLA